MVVQRKPAIKKVGGKVFALDYGRLMGDPVYFRLFPFISPFLPFFDLFYYFASFAIRSNTLVNSSVSKK